MVGTTGFEPATPCTPCKCATRLRHVPFSRHPGESRDPVLISINAHVCKIPAFAGKTGLLFGFRDHGTELFQLPGQRLQRCPLTVAQARSGGLLGRLRGDIAVAGLGRRLFDHLVLALLAEQLLNALDRIALRVQQVMDGFQNIHVLRTVITPTAAALERPYLRKLGFPETEHMLLDIQILGHLADGAKSARRLAGFFGLLSLLGRLLLFRSILGRDKIDAWLEFAALQWAGLCIHNESP